MELCCILIRQGGAAVEYDWGRRVVEYGRWELGGGIGPKIIQSIDPNFICVRYQPLLLKNISRYAGLKSKLC